MSDLMIMYCYYADERDKYANDKSETGKAKYMMNGIIARAYAKEVQIVANVSEMG